jgi:hypothetical protein
MERLLKSFPAEDDAGHHYTVEVYQDYANSGVAAGTHTFETSHGTRVQRLRRGEYQLKSSGKLLHSKHPDAE